MKFTLDVPVGGPFTFTSAAEANAAGNPFAAAVLAIPDVRSLFGTADFVTVTRAQGADWDPIIAAVQRAAEELI